MLYFCKWSILISSNVFGKSETEIPKTMIFSQKVQVLVLSFQSGTDDIIPSFLKLTFINDKDGATSHTFKNGKFKLQ